MKFIGLLAAATAPGAFPTNAPSTPEGVVQSILTFLLWVVGVIGVIMITYSGFMYITSAGNSQRTKAALQSIIYTAVGFAVALMAQSIVQLVVPAAQNAPNVQTIVTNGMGIFMWVIGVAAVIMVLVGGLLYVTSAGDPGRAKTAKDTILYAVIGLAIAVMGSAIIAFVQNQLG